MPYLVDGNNLAHALGLSKGGLADRESCARTVGRFCRERGARATVVFDGPAPPGSPAVTEHHRLRMVFSETRSADEVILRRLGESASAVDFIVVTSDKSLGDRARHRGARVERAHEFARRLRGPKEAREAGVEKPAPRQTPDEIEAWMKVFGSPRRPDET